MTNALLLAPSDDALLGDGRPATRVPLPRGETLVAARELVKPGAHIALVLAPDREDREWRVEDAVWGLAPRHVADRAAFRRRYRTHRVREDLLAQSRVFAPPWRRGQRCAIPLTGFAWWRRDDRGVRRGIAHASSCVLAAGLYVPAAAPDGSDMSAALVVRGTHDRLEPIVLPPASLEGWLARGPDEAMQMLAQLRDHPWRDQTR